MIKIRIALLEWATCPCSTLNKKKKKKKHQNCKSYVHIYQIKTEEYYIYSINSLNVTFLEFFRMFLIIFENRKNSKYYQKIKNHPKKFSMGHI